MLPQPAPLDWARPAASSVIALASHDACASWDEVAQPERRRVAASLHSVWWSRRHAGEFRDFLQQHSAARRWFPTGGEEWWLLPASRSFYVAMLVLKVLASGHYSNARMRSLDERVLHRRTCFRCQTPAVIWTWCTPAAAAPAGESWCGQCVGELRTIGGWPMLVDGGAPDSAFAEWALRLRSSVDTELAGAAWIDSCFGVCPLCGFGERGSEHVLIWCLAVARAWFLVAPMEQPVPLLRALMEPGRHTPLLADLLCHVGRMYSSLRTASLHYMEASRILAGQVRAANIIGTQGGTLDEDWHDLETVDLEEHAIDIVPTWDDHPAGPCSCCLHSPPGVAASAAWFLRGTSRRPLGENLAGLRALRHLRSGDVAATLFGDAPRARWMPPRRGWFPPPHIDPDRANARWTVIRCTECGQHVARIVAVRDVPPEEEVCVDEQPHVLSSSDDSCEFVGTFDGGARPHAGTKVAGAGAWLWRRNDHGVLVPYASVVVALPGETNAPRAEAHGCRALLLTLESSGARRRRASLAGDNLAVVRHAAAQGRLASQHVQGVIESVLQRVALAGWVLDWAAVRRRFNHAADEQATQGVQWARQLFDAGLRAPRSRVTWYPA